jgi:hypothetical protein
MSAPSAAVVAPSVADDGREASRSNERVKARGRRVERRPCAGGGRLTLEQRLESVWEGLLAAGAAECPLCRGPMEAAAGGGRCGDCGSTLS